MEKYPNLGKLLVKYPPLVDSYMYKELLHGDPEYLYKASLHLLRAGGKRVRPVIVLSVARMLGGLEAEQIALPLAAGVELFHNFTLIHDDIMDKDTMRRGVPTVHVIYGEDTAILAGDLLFALSFKAITQSLGKGLSLEGSSRALEVLSEAAVRVSRGQAYDMRFEREENVTYHDYLDMIYLKTGALIEASARLGAIAAEADRDTEEALGNYGAFVGVAFQIRDDILGVFGDPEKTGKPVYNDLRRGKKTILLLYALAHSSGEDRRVLEAVAKGKAGENEVREAARIIEKTGALEYATKLAKTYSDNAVAIIEDLEKTGETVDEEAASALKELARFVVERDK